MYRCWGRQGRAVEAHGAPQPEEALSWDLADSREMPVEGWMLRVEVREGKEVFDGSGSLVGTDKSQSSTSTCMVERKGLQLGEWGCALLHKSDVIMNLRRNPRN